MACDPNTLLEQAKCYQCDLTGDLFPAVEIVLLCAWRDGTPLSCDPQSLMSEANCIRSCIPLGMMQAVKTALLCDIASGTVTCSDPAAPSELAAFMGSGSLLDFDGIDDRVVVPNSASLNITTALTIEAWVFSDGAASGGVFEKTVAGAANTSFLSSIAFTFLFFRLVKGAAITEIYTDAAFPVSVWTHVAGTWDGATLRLYINGVQQIATAALASPIDTGAGDSYIGQLAGGFFPLDGKLDEVRIWNVARTQAQVVAWKDRPLVGTEPGLAAYWRFDENGGLSAFDSTVNGNTGTLTGVPLWASSQVFPDVQASISWTDNATDETSYEVRYRNVTQGGGFVDTPALPAGSTGTVFTVAGALDGNSIEIQVRAVNGICASAWVSVTVVAVIFS